jgi:hypothetical protein
MRLARARLDISTLGSQFKTKFAMLRADRNQDAGPPRTASRCNRTPFAVDCISGQGGGMAQGLTTQFPLADLGIRNCAGGPKISNPNWLCKNRQSTQRAEKSYPGKRSLRRGVTNTGLLGSAYVLAVRPWHTGCLFVSSHAVLLSSSFRFVVLV